MALRASIPANNLKPIRSQLGVLNRVLDLLVTEVILNNAGVITSRGEIVTAAVAEHMRMNREFKASQLTGSGDNLANGVVS
jgi:hypothetical protein